MHCPRCGLEQVDGETRFCRTCGFPLEDVKELLIPDPNSEKALDRRKTSAFNQGLALMLLTLVLVIVMTILGDVGLVPEFVTKLVAAFFLLASLARMFYPYVVPPPEAGKVLSRASTPESKELPGSLPQRGFKASVRSHRDASAQFAEVPSVTEQTTRKLKEMRDED